MLKTLYRKSSSYSLLFQLLLSSQFDTKNNDLRQTGGQQLTFQRTNAWPPAQRCVIKGTGAKLLILAAGYIVSPLVQIGATLLRLAYWINDKQRQYTSKMNLQVPSMRPIGHWRSTTDPSCRANGLVFGLRLMQLRFCCHTEPPITVKYQVQRYSECENDLSITMTPLIQRCSQCHTELTILWVQRRYDCHTKSTKPILFRFVIFRTLLLLCIF